MKSGKKHFKLGKRISDTLVIYAQVLEHNAKISDLTLKRKYVVAEDSPTHRYDPLPQRSFTTFVWSEFVVLH